MNTLLKRLFRHKMASDSLLASSKPFKNEKKLLNPDAEIYVRLLSFPAFQIPRDPQLRLGSARAALPSDASGGLRSGYRLHAVSPRRRDLVTYMLCAYNLPFSQFSGIRTRWRPVTRTRCATARTRRAQTAGHTI